MANFILGELVLSEEEIEVATTCRVEHCGGKMIVRSRDVLSSQRRKHKPDEQETECLKCSRCEGPSTITCQLENALQHGFQRCCKKPTD